MGDLPSVALPILRPPCRAIPATNYPPAPLWDTADCSPADVAPVTCPDLADRSLANFDDYDNYDDYGDYDGDVIASVTSMEEYQERDVILSDVVLPQTDWDELSTELET